MPTTKIALVFDFDAQEMLSICEGAKTIVITSYLEKVKTQGGQEVGAMRVKAKAKGRAVPKTMTKAKTTKGEETIYGCPVPPCSEE
jgi:hypothetical protein